MYARADYTSQATDRRSASGVIAFLNGSTVVWCSRMQMCVPLTIAKAEDVTTVDSLKKGIFVQKTSVLIPL